MKSKEDIFTRELNISQSEIDKAIQYFYTRNTMNAKLAKDAVTLAIINKNARFWIAISNALHESFFIVLGRIFDQSSPHNIDKLLSMAQKHIDIFSKDALRLRKLTGSSNGAEWIDEYMKHVYVPTNEDFRKLRKHVARYRRIYERVYKIIRNKVIAHKILSNPDEVHALYSRTDIKEMEKLLVSLNKINHALWQLYHNGRKPVLSNMKYSAARMKDNEIPKWKSSSIQEHAVDDTVKFFQLLKTVSE